MAYDDDVKELATSGRDKRARPSRAPPRGGRRRNSGNDLPAPSSQMSGTHSSLGKSDDDDDHTPDLGAAGRRASLHSRSISPHLQNSTSPRPPTVGHRRSSLMGHQSGTQTLTGKTDGQNTNVRVMVRVRPFSSKEVEEVEKEGGYMQSVIDMPRRDQVLLLDHKSEYAVAQGFNFDEVFWSCTQQKSNSGFADQKRVYEWTGLPALQAAWDGINSCIFAYGQTGSGKTHTMMGDPEQIANPEGCAEELLGVIPRLCRDLFDELEKKEKNAAQAGLRRKSDVRVRFYEIYNEKVKDLLCSVEGEQERFKYAGTTQKKLDPDDLKIREHPTEGPYVEGISIHNPRSYEDIIRLINAGNQERSVGSTNLNDRSSRSHALFRITVTQTTFYDQQRVGIGGPKTTTHQRRANVNLVDLAGSENVKRSGARGSLLLEAQKINLSLTTLRRVIDALIEKKAKVNVPYRDSTLTWLLREDLGGNSKTFMLATVSPHYINAHESLRTLEYAMRARAIVNSVRVNEDETAKMLADLEKKMLEARKQMSDARTDAEVEALEQQMDEAKKARSEIEERLEEASAEVTEYKEKLEAEKEKNMAFAFRHAVMLRAAKLRLSSAESRSQGQSAELMELKKKMAATGHDNMDDLAVSLHRERGKVTEMEKKNLEMQRQKEDIERKHADLLQRMAVEENRAVQGRLTAEGLERDSKQKEQQYKEEIDRIHTTLSKQYEEIVDKHAEQLRTVETNHDKELRAIIDENQSMAEEFQNKLQELELKLSQQAEEHAKAMRLLEKDREEQQRYLHADIQRREEMIDKLEFELNEATQLKEKYQHELRAQREVIEREKAESEYKTDSKIRDQVAEANKKCNEKLEAMREMVVKAEEDADARSREKIEIQKFFSEVANREDKYAQTFDLVCHFLQQLPANGDIPENWSMEDIKRLLRAFQQFKKDYASYRPSRETLKAMLRMNPVRRGAERIRQLLDHEEDGEDELKGSIKVLMGGMRCPDLGSTGTIPRLDGSPEKENGGDPSRESAAAGTAYRGEGGTPSSLSQTHASLKAGTLSKRRSRSSPRMSTGGEFAADATPPMKKRGSKQNMTQNKAGKVRDFSKSTFAKAPASGRPSTSSPGAK
eukprot:TRINITY_DN38_c0_g1_i1.p1 TRINITY_DN38_c0_g1~~TRINITY_DN38_c0_g1_i1.p1  ORF type:complete len:1120 (+),score=538.32 TRINITY_DN38_c0_g1_i1:114-3473(+)